MCGKRAERLAVGKAAGEAEVIKPAGSEAISFIIHDAFTVKLCLVAGVKSTTFALGVLMKEHFNVRQCVRVAFAGGV